MILKRLFSLTTDILGNSTMFKINSRRSINRIPSKTLYTRESLRIDAFEESRKNSQAVFKDKEGFIDEMTKKCSGDVNYLIFHDDLRKMIGLSETDEDLSLLKEMIAKFYYQGTVIRFGSFNLGPQVMRLYYSLNKPAEALELFQNKKVGGVFEEVTSLVLLANMLFENEMYEEITELFYESVDRQYNGKKYIPNLVNFFFAACYKLGTQESFEKALSTWNSFKQAQFFPSFIAKLFFGAHALLVKKPDITLEVLENMKLHSVQLNLKVIALCEKKEFDQVLTILNELLFNDSPRNEQYFITSDTFSYLEGTFKNESEAYCNKFLKLKDQLTMHNFIKEQELDQCLLEPREYGKGQIKERKQVLI